MAPTPLRFGGRMSDQDALLWALDTSAAVPSTITVVVMLEGCADPRAVMWSVERLTRRLARFRDRVVPSPVPTAPPRWEPDPDFALSRHLVRSRVGSALTPEVVLRRAETAATSPFDADHPLWHMQLLTGSEGDGALIVTLHHSLSDGVGLVLMASELFDFQAEPTFEAAGPGVDAAEPASETPWVDRIQADLADELRYGARLLGSVLPWAAASAREAAGVPGPRAAETFRTVRALRSLAESAARPGSPILVARSAGCRLGSVSLTVADLRLAARRAGGTLNDVFLAGLLGGLRRYHSKHGSQPSSLRIGVPMSTRQGEGEGAVGNQVAPMLVRAPLQLTDPVERVRLLHELVAEARRHPALDLLDSAAGVVRRVPGSLQVLKRLLGYIDVLASNVPGSPVDLYLGGARVERIIPIGPRGGTALNVTLLSHVGSVEVGVNMDPVAIPDPGVLVDCLYAGFDETLG